MSEPAGAAVSRDGGARPLVWGPLASLAFTGVLWLVFNLLTLGVAMLFMHYGWADARTRPDQLGGNGLFLAVTTLINAVICITLVVLLVRLRGGLPLRAYLGLQAMRGRDGLLWLGILVLFITTSEGAGYLLERPVVPEFMINAYQTAGLPVLLWLALIVAAPLFEEILFRGFLQSGLQWSGVHRGLALLLPAFIWAGVHLQYDYYDMSWVFLFGLLLGLARWHTDSLLTPLLMHMLVNLMATVVTVLLLV